MAARSHAVKSETLRETAASPPTTSSTPATPILLLPAPTRRRADLGIPACIRHDLIEQAAYFRAERRGFAPGHEVDDWLAAEQEVDALLRERYL
jgi:Protein of unknown function (DUF2934)